MWGRVIREVGKRAAQRSAARRAAARRRRRDRDDDDDWDSPDFELSLELAGEMEDGGGGCEEAIEEAMDEMLSLCGNGGQESILDIGSQAFFDWGMSVCKGEGSMDTLYGDMTVVLREDMWDATDEIWPEGAMIVISYVEEKSSDLPLINQKALDNWKDAVSRRDLAWVASGRNIADHKSEYRTKSGQLTNFNKGRWTGSQWIFD